MFLLAGIIQTDDTCEQTAEEKIRSEEKTSDKWLKNICKFSH